MNRYQFGDGQPEDVYNTACLRELKQTIHYEGAESVAAMMVEPIISGGEVIVQPEGYLRGVREICDRIDSLIPSGEAVFAIPSSCG